MGQDRQSDEALKERCASLEEKNRDLVARVQLLSEENRANGTLLRILLENTPFGIILFDAKQRVIQINKAAESILNLQRVKVIGKTCDTVFNCFENNQQRCPVLDDKKTLDRVETDCRSDLCQCDTQLLRSVVKIEDNGEPILVEAFVDISPIKQAQLEIENANQTKDNFLSKVSHELRTPLNSILGFTELLQDALPQTNNQDQSLYLKNILLSGKKLLCMVDEVLDITLITAQRMKLDEYRLEVAGLLRQVCEDMAGQCEEHGNSLHIRCAEEAQYLYADPYRLQQILYHLLDNACKFTRQGEISVSVGKEYITGANWLVFRVKDTGIGMDAKQQAAIFTEFEQADAGNTRRHGGAGLGLTLC